MSPPRWLNSRPTGGVCRSGWGSAETRPAASCPAGLWCNDDRLTSLHVSSADGPSSPSFLLRVSDGSQRSIEGYFFRIPPPPKPARPARPAAPAPPMKAPPPTQTRPSPSPAPLDRTARPNTPQRASRQSAKQAVYCGMENVAQCPETVSASLFFCGEGAKVLAP